MKTKRKLVPKCTPVCGDAGSVQGNVVGRDLCHDVCGVGPSVSPKRQCVREPSSVPSPDQGSLVRKSTAIGDGACGVGRNLDGREFYANDCGVGPSVSPKRQCIRQSASVASFDRGPQIPQVPTVGPTVSPTTCVRQPTPESVEFKRISLTGFRSCTSRSHYRSVSKQTIRYLTLTVEEFLFVTVSTKEHHSECSGNYHKDNV
ncbi:hypothetical protein Tco_1304558 [Tanacetum coccineum]